jgi:hypothetical protein
LTPGFLTPPLFLLTPPLFFLCPLSLGLFGLPLDPLFFLPLPLLLV